jgi:hypothetical protein
MESLKASKEKANIAAEAAHDEMVQRRHLTFERLHIRDAIWSKDTRTFSGGILKPETFSDAELVVLSKGKPLPENKDNPGHTEACQDSLDYIAARMKGNKASKEAVKGEITRRAGEA